MKRFILAGLLLALAGVAFCDEGEIVICPDGKSKCPIANTCCKLSSGKWGCCPMPKAVCCSDHLHCCPNGYKCDVSAATCTRADVTIPWYQKTVAHPIQVENVICSGGTAQCPDGNTCCKLASGQWGCCPLPKAVCCSDHIHCCPSGNKCDVKAGTCIKADVTIPWFEKNVAIQVTAKNVPCPGGQSYCPDGNTCCKLTSGQWGCCPIPSAVCCSDHIHCCPSGYTCDVSAGTCTIGDETIPWSEKNVAIQITAKSVNCPGGQAYCPDGSTCCKLASGQWGCCPIPNAVCCSDHIHCCPSGYTCDVSAGSCTKADETIPWSKKSVAIQITVDSIPWLTKIPASLSEDKSTIVKCADGQSECPDGNTCCKLSSGQWGCCPLPKAVCCSDGIHCCPSGYTCDVTKGACNKKEETVAWSVKTHAVASSVGNVACNASASCPNGDVCCKLPSGRWGCCTFTNGVCCKDHLHCCPAGTTCTATPGKCIKKSEEISWSTQNLALSSMVNTVKCDAKTECPDNFTCCRLKSGWGCCPQPKANCCKDLVHCCPSGYKCNTAKGTCDK